MKVMGMWRLRSPLCPPMLCKPKARAGHRPPRGIWCHFAIKDLGAQRETEHKFSLRSHRVAWDWHAERFRSHPQGPETWLLSSRVAVSSGKSNEEGSLGELWAHRLMTQQWQRCHYAQSPQGCAECPLAPGACWN